MTTVRATTGIGSLPHHNVDAALEFSFRMGIPFFPQIPVRNPWEFMIAQALDGLPGTLVERDGAVTLDLDVWSSRSRALDAELSRAFEAPASDRAAFDSFEPQPATASCWQPFVWELAERDVPWAKCQIAGPMTAQWALKIPSKNGPDAGGSEITRRPELATQVYRLVLARSIAMVRGIAATGAQPLIYLDEPGLYAFDRSNPRTLMGLEELRLMMQSLKKEGAVVGLHCCGETDWGAVLGLPLDVLSIDAGLSLKSLLAAARGRQIPRLSLGVIPTNRSPLARLNARDLHGQALVTFREAGYTPPAAQELMAEAILTPACGLALHEVADAEAALELLNDFHALVDVR